MRLGKSPCSAMASMPRLACPPYQVRVSLATVCSQCSREAIHGTHRTLNVLVVQSPSFVLNSHDRQLKVCRHLSSEHLTASRVAHSDNRCLRSVERTYSLPDLIISASAATTPLPLGRTNSGFTSISVIELPWSTISHESLCMASASASVSASELPR